MSQVKREEISESDLFKDVRFSAVQTIEQIKLLNNEIRESAIILEKELGSAIIKDTKSLQSFTKAIGDANKMKNQSIQLDKLEAQALDLKTKSEINSEKLKQQTIKTEREIIRNSQILTKQKEAEERANQKNKKAIEDNNNAYKKLVNSTREQKNESKRLAIEMINLANSGKRNSKEYKELANTYRTVTREAQAGDKVLKKIDSTVGDNFRNVGNYSSAVKGLTRNIQQLAGGFGLFTAIRGSVQTLRDFDEGLAGIQKTTGLTKNEVKGIVDELLKIDTRTSVTALQELTTSAGRLGITGKQNIIDFVVSADQAFVALGDDLGGTADEIATNLGKIASVFGDEERLGIGKSITVVGSTLNTLASESKASAGAILDFTNRMAGVAGVAGIPQAEIQALGALFDSTGQSVEVASTTLNTLLPKLASNQSEYAKVANMTAESFSALIKNNPIEALKAVAIGAKSSNGGLDGLVKTLGDFGVESSRAASIVGILANETDQWAKLQKIGNEEAEKATGLSKEFNVQNNTLNANLEKLGKEFDKYVLGINSAGNVTGSFGDIIGFLIKNLELIIDSIIKLGTSYLIFTARQKILNSGLIDFSKNLFKSKDAIKGVGAELTNSESGAKKFAGSLKSIGWTAIIGLAFELGTELYRIASGAAQAEEDMARLEKTTNNALKSTEKNIKNIKSVLSLKLEDIDLKIKSGELKDEKEILKLKQEAIEISSKELSNNIDRVRERKDKYLALKKEAELLAKIQFSESKGDAFKLLKSEKQKKAEERILEIQKELGLKSTNIFGNENTISAGDLIGQLGANINATSKSIEAYKNELSDLDLELNRNIASTKGLEKVSSKDFETKKINSTKEINTEFKNQIDLIKELNNQYDIYLKSSQNIEASDISELIASKNELIEAEKTLQISNGERFGTGNDNNIIELINERKDIQIENIQSVRDYEIKAVKDANLIRLNEIKNSTENEYKELIKGANGNKKAIAKIELNYQNELNKIKQIEIESENVLNTQIIEIKNNANNEILQLDRDTANEIKGVQNEIKDSNKTAMDKAVEDAKEANDKILENEKEASKKRQELAGMLTDYLIKQSDKRIEAIDKEISAHEAQYEDLKQKAINGNINAQESLEEEHRLIKEANIAKMREEKRKQRIELASTAFSSYEKNIESGSKTPLADTIRDISLLQAFINSIPAFEKGTEDTGKTGNGIDGKGGFLSVLHPNEGVIPKELNKKKLGAKLTNESAINYAIKYKEIIKENSNMNINDVSSNILNNSNDGWKNIELYSQINGLKTKMDEVVKAIENKQETTIDIEKVIDGTLWLSKQTKKGNLLINNRYRFKG